MPADSHRCGDTHTALWRRPPASKGLLCLCEGERGGATFRQAPGYGGGDVHGSPCVYTDALPEPRQGYRADNSFCIARSERVPSERVRQVFEQIDANEILAPNTQEFIGCECTNAKGVRIRIPGPGGFPDFFQTFLQDFQGELIDPQRCAI